MFSYVQKLFFFCSCLEAAQENVATAGIASFAAVLVLLLGLAVLVAWQFSNNRKLKRRLKSMQHQRSINETEKNEEDEKEEEKNEDNVLAPLKTKAHSQ